MYTLYKKKKTIIFHKIAMTYLSSIHILFFENT